jgi:uncharacterized repeat protein (TIGR03803 family)
VILDAARNVYGTTEYDGPSRHSDGVVFQPDPQSGRNLERMFCTAVRVATTEVYLRLAWFSIQRATSMARPRVAALYGYGVVFKLTRNADGSWTERVLHQFTGKDGGNPLAALTFDSSGNLYGTASSGGAYGYGVIFKLTPTSSGGWQYRALHDFNDAPAAGPAAGLIFDGAGNLYGTTTGGDGGTVSELTP